MPSRLSYSAISTYAECGEKFRLERLHKIPTGTWWATIAGKAVHYLSECYDTIEVFKRPFECEVQGGTVHSIESIATFRQAFDYFFTKEGFEGQEIKASGRKSLNDYAFSGGPNGRDREWWYRFGPTYVEAYRTWRDERVTNGPWELLEVEVKFEIMAGGFIVIGAIDRVFFDTESGCIVIVDIKTGVNEPTDALQTLTYREGLSRTMGITAEWAYYVFFRWAEPEVEVIAVPKPEGRRPGKVQLAKAQAALEAFGDPPWDFNEEPHAEILKRQAAFDEHDRAVAAQEAQAGPQEPGRVEAYLSYGTDLTGYEAAFLDRVYEQARVGIANQVFPFNTTGNCIRQCGVSEFCRAVGGKRAHEYPITNTIKFRSPEHEKMSGASLTSPTGEAGNVSPTTSPEEGA